MSDHKAQIEEYARSENGWVRARIIKQDLPEAMTLLQIAERGRDTAAISLGTQHSAYAVALLNLGIYYDFIEHKSVKAQELFDQARAILEQSQTGSTPYAEALFELGTARKERKLPTDDPRITEAYLNVSLRMQRRHSEQLMAADETRGSGPWMDRLDEACIYHSLDEKTAAANPMATGWEERFASGLQAIAGIITRHRDYLRDHKAADAWGCATPPQVCERLAAFAPANAEWMRGLADAYDIIGNEQAGADQLASFRAALFFRERLIAVDQQRAALLRQYVEKSTTNNKQTDNIEIPPLTADRPAARLELPSSNDVSKSKDTRSKDRAKSEGLASRENEWVRTRIMKGDAPAEGSLLQIAERARDAAAKSLGTQHPAYAVSLQNLGFYYELLENDTVKANEFYERARNVLALPLAEGLYLLGLFHLKTREDAKRADAALNAALAIQHEALDENDLPLAETMLALADARAKQSDLDSAIELANEALRIQLIQYYWEGPGIPQPVADTQARLDELRALARARSADVAVPEDN
jgi:tetratricopeptide (TPR) repeat protein